MTVIKKEGSVPLEWKAEVTCKKDDKHDKAEHCGAVLEITEKDIVLRFYEGTHFTHFYSVTKCPCCGKYNRIKVPESVWGRINTAKNQESATFDGFSERI